MSETTETPDVEPTTEEVPGEPIDPNPSLVESRERYRTERDTARVELAAAQERVERMQRAEVERLAADAGLSIASDVFTMSGNEPADYLDDDGNVDAEKVAADVAAVLAERPGLRKNAPAFDPTQGSGGRNAPKPEPSLSAMIKGAVTQPGMPVFGG